LLDSLLQEELLIKAENKKKLQRSVIFEALVPVKETPRSYPRAWYDRSIWRPVYRVILVSGFIIN